MKSNKQYRDAALGAFIGWIGIILFCLIMVLFTGCVGTYYITDAEFDDTREEHVNITYHNGNVYWGYHQEYWYYYGKPHFYPWYYYYTVCPPVNYSVHYHVNIHRNSNLPVRIPKRDRLFDNSSNVKVWNIKEQSVRHMQTIPNNKRPNIKKINTNNKTILSPKVNIRHNKKRKN